MEAWTGFKPYVGEGYVHDDRRADGQSVATFRFKAPKSGRYDVRHGVLRRTTRAKKVPVTIQNDGRMSELFADQTQPLPAGEAFRTIGRVELDAGAETVVTVSNHGTAGFVILDALQFVVAKD